MNASASESRASAKTFVGFGFGPIQSGLFLYEAYRSGNFDRFVVAEVDSALVDSVRRAGGRYALNIARTDSIDRVEIGGVELYDPAVEADREALLSAIAEGDEMATSLPSVRFYDVGSETSVARLLAEGVNRRDAERPTIVYAAENHNHAAELLREALAPHAGADALGQLDVLNTVIGKMSGVIDEAETIRRLKLATLTPDSSRAVLVEEFNRILVRRVKLEGASRGIEVFGEKDDLLPFEEAKLYGHNAIHALIGFLADRAGYRTMGEVRDDERILEIARRAFLQDSGGALLARHAGLDDPLFTPEGYRAYAEDLLERMVNPHLDDRVARVVRDPVRKLGWDDRIYGTMRLAVEYGISPRSLAAGAAAGLRSMVRRRDELDESPAALPDREDGLDAAAVGKLLREIWGPAADGETADTLIELTQQAL
jgi:mannitol-1-phosphate 5-dehydrogenase